MDEKAKLESISFSKEDWKLILEALDYTSKHLPFYTREQQNKVFEFENVISLLTFAMLNKGMIQIGENANGNPKMDS